jgi:hypothetical protein
MNALRPVHLAIATAMVMPAIALATSNPPHSGTQGASSSSSLHAHVQALTSRSPSGSWTPAPKTPHVRANGQTMQMPAMPSTQASHKTTHY